VKSHFGFRARACVVVAVAVVGLVAAFVLPPLQQAEEYHRFADQRRMVGIPNCLNVVSNAAFLIVGLAGLVFLARTPSKTGPGGFVESSERWAYTAFFVGVTLTGIGSAYYHWQPGNATLVWDRLPLTLTFMAMLAATITERIHVRLGVWLLAPLIAAGAASIWYWHRTGNLWPYGYVQFYSPVLVGLMIWLFPPRYSRTPDFLWVIGIYALAKLMEAFDQPILSAVKVVSGHTLKHLIAAVAVFWLMRMLWLRRSDFVEPAGSRGGIVDGFDGTVTEDGGQQRPVASRQVGSVKDPIIHTGLAGERKDGIVR
jgi:hypothetical protein